MGGFRALALVPNATGIGKTQSGHTPADPGKSCWFVLNAYLSMNHSGNKALFYDHSITYTFGVQALQRIFWATSFIHFIDRRWSALNDPCNDNPGLMSQETADKRGFGFIIHKSIVNPKSLDGKKLFTEYF